MEDTNTISEQFEKYLNELVGNINLDDQNLDQEYVHGIDAARIIQSRHAINAMISSISSENIIIMFNKDTKGLRNFGDIDALDLEILLNHLVLGVLVSIKNKNKMCLNHYQDKVLCVESANGLAYNHTIIYSANYYDQELDKLIAEKHNRIDELLHENVPSSPLSSEIEKSFLTSKNK